MKSLQSYAADHPLGYCSALRQRKTLGLVEIGYRERASAIGFELEIANAENKLLVLNHDDRVNNKTNFKSSQMCSPPLEGAQQIAPRRIKAYACVLYPERVIAIH